jgi:predicted nuclease with TOPRIM domain
MELSGKIANIKEKITHIASKMEALRVENRKLIEENKELKTKLQRDAEEMKFLRHQLAVFKERVMTQSPNEVVEEEEGDV